jgi:uncharacterized repeat protein (TIGR04076 family)
MDRRPPNLNVYQKKLRARSRAILIKKREIIFGRRLMQLVIKVAGIKGHCPVYRVGHKLVLKEGYILDTRETDTVCMHSLASLLPYYVALSRGIKAKDLGLSRDGSDKAYVQCLDPCEITGGGTVLFEISLDSDASETP